MSTPDSQTIPSSDSQQILWAFFGVRTPAILRGDSLKIVWGWDRRDSEVILCGFWGLDSIISQGLGAGCRGSPGILKGWVSEVGHSGFSDVGCRFGGWVSEVGHSRDSRGFSGAGRPGRDRARSLG